MYFVIHYDVIYRRPLILESTVKLKLAYKELWVIITYIQSHNYEY